MNDKKIPKGWEECAPSECTQVWISLAEVTLPAARNLDHDMAVRVNGEWISDLSWPILGIIPIRKVPPPEPIEFVVGDIHVECEYVVRRECGDECVPKQYMTMVPEGVKKGMRFRQVVEE